MDNLEEQNIETMSPGINLLIVVFICMNVIYLGEYFNLFSLEIDKQSKKVYLTTDVDRNI